MSFRTAVTIYFAALALAVVIIMIFMPKAEAFEGKWGFEKQPWELVTPEPSVTVDRYQAIDWKNDPSVLVALPKERPSAVEPEIKTVIKYVLEKPEPEPIVTYSYEED